MKILIVSKSQSIRSQGSIQTYIWSLSEHLIRAGHEVSILTTTNGQPQTHTIEGRTVIEIPYVSLFCQFFMPLFLKEICFNNSAKRWLQQHSNQFDIIHLQDKSGFSYPMSINTKPIVSTFQGLDCIENPQKMVEKHFSWEKIAAQTLKYYQRVIAEAETAKLQNAHRVVYVKKINLLGTHS